ncbi:hypothetical protein ACNKHX_04840 [Shigella flexneri]
MTTLKLDTLSDRIKAHKNALVRRETASLYRARARRCCDVRQHLDKPKSRYVARWHWRITWRIAPSGSTRPAHHRQQASEVRAAPLFPKYTDLDRKEIDELAIAPARLCGERRKQPRSALTVPSGAVRPYRIAATACLQQQRGCWRPESSKPKAI